MTWCPRPQHPAESGDPRAHTSAILTDARTGEPVDLTQGAGEQRILRKLYSGAVKRGATALDDLSAPRLRSCAQDLRAEG